MGGGGFFRTLNRIARRFDRVGAIPCARRYAWRVAQRTKADSLSPTSRSLLDDFHRLYYEEGRGGGTWKNTYWLGIPTHKCALDLWIYQEILFETRPSLIVETGTLNGGSALFLASICDLLGNGHVITIDVKHRGGRPGHPRITYLHGSSTDARVVSEVRQRAASERVMVTLDSDHSRAHVLAEMRAYGDLVSPGCYMVVEDTNLNGHPVSPEFGAGPMEAVEELLSRPSPFVEDASQAKLLLSFNPRGYLRRLD